MTTERYHEILSYLRGLVDGTEWQDHLYAVGGCCRDSIMGCEIKDIDLAVDLPGGGIGFAEWIHGLGLSVKAPVTFPQFGTAMLRLSQFPDDEIEIVQTRAEKYTDRTRRDPTTAFGSIDTDCRRRDLTINALYYHIHSGRMLDILGCSIEDIRNHIIRTPDDPDLTFDDDPVRILRVVRLASRYGWDIQEATFEGMKHNAHRLSIVRPERMQAEIDKMLTGPAPARAMDLLRQIGAIEVILPELAPTITMKQNTNHIGTVWEHTLAVVEKVPPTLLLRMAALLHEAGKTLGGHIGRDGQIHFTGHQRRGRGIINTILRRLHYDSDFIDRVIFLVVNHKAAKDWGPKAEHMPLADLRRLQHKCANRDRFGRLMALIDADNNSFAPGHGMPHQVERIMEVSAELDRKHTSMFTFRRPIPQAKIRKIKGLGRNADLTVYDNFILDILFDDPTTPTEEIRRRLRAFNP